MEFVVYIFLVVTILTLGLLSFRDRIFGIIGGIIGLSGGEYLLGDQTLVTTRVWDITTQSWQGYTANFAQVQLEAEILGVFAILDLLIVIGITNYIRNNKPLSER